MFHEHSRSDQKAAKNRGGEEEALLNSVSPLRPSGPLTQRFASTSQFGDTVATPDPAITPGQLILVDKNTRSAEPLRSSSEDPVKIVLTVGDAVHSVDHETRNSFIGRHSMCDIRVRSEFTSRTHAHFVVRDDGFHLIDVSRNGTFVTTDAGETFLLKRNLRFPLTGSGVIGFGAPCVKSGDWLVQYACM